MNTGWRFGEFVLGSYRPDFKDKSLAKVTLPHCVVNLSWHGWKPKSWDDTWIYRRHFDVAKELSGLRFFIEFAGVLTGAKVFVNGHRLGEHLGGYVPFDYEATGKLKPRDNVLAVVVDSSWGLNVPPDKPEPAAPSSIDFLQPGGIYRGVSLKVVPQIFLKDVFAKPVDVLDKTLRRVEVECAVDAAAMPRRSARLEVELRSGRQTVSRASAKLGITRRGEKTVKLTLKNLGDVSLWDVEAPNLYEVVTTLYTDGRALDERRTRIGFREARFEKDGFFLNGRRVKIFGLNRHQFYPYVGAAMPGRVQRKDAEILKKELNCNMVRCSHYPQSEAFLDACDELGLMVWEEAPGWRYVGDESWRKRTLRDVRRMVIRDRNHPSIIVWGTRLNETIDYPAFYTKTRELAKDLDGSRPTTGAVRRAPNDFGPVKTSIFGKVTDPYSTTEFLQDVFAYNDYSEKFVGGDVPLFDLPTLRPPRIDLPYMISEAVGTLIGPRFFRRTDSQGIQERQAVLHAAVHDSAASDDRYCGLLAWCAFDYSSSQGNNYRKLKTPGVADIFRVPKLGAAFYQSQVDPHKRPVIEPSFYWDFGPKSPQHGPGKNAIIWSNCERLEIFIDNRRLAPPRPDRKHFPHLEYPPFLARLVADGEKHTDLRIDGYLGGRLVLSRRFSSDPSKDRISLVADDKELAADGSDATRLVFRAVDGYGAPRPYVEEDVVLSLDGPGVIVGDNPFAFAEAGGVGAVWVRTVEGRSGRIRVRAKHPALGNAKVIIQAR